MVPEIATTIRADAFGFAAGELAGWVRGRFDAGWRRLSVIDCTTGRLVGWIGRDGDTGRRIWWADTDYIGRWSM